MILINHLAKTALVVKRGRLVTYVVCMTSGKLALTRLDEQGLKLFMNRWKPYDYPLAKAKEMFLKHARRDGATQEALDMLEAFDPTPPAEGG